MQLDLRSYQTRTCDYVRERERTGPFRTCIQGPTGCGKSVMQAALLLDDTPQLLLTHRRILLDQLAAVLKRYGVRFGLRAAGHAFDSAAPIQLGMIQTEWKRTFGKNAHWELPKATRVHIDELHANTGPVAQRVLQALFDRDASVIGWTASPIQVAHLVDELYVAATVKELIADGWLVPPVIFTPDGPSAEKFEMLTPQSNGEYSPKDIESIWQPKLVLGRVIENYFRLNPLRKPASLFAPGVAHSLWFAQQFTYAGIPSAHLDGRQLWVDGKFYDSDSKARQDVFARHQGGDIRILTNRYCLREGWDAPWVEHVILATLFGSRASFVQACGRGLRISPETGKKRCVFQDHGANFWRFPQLDSTDAWDMGKPHRQLQREYEERRRSGTDMGAPEPIVCQQCNALRMSGPVCPECQHRHVTYARRVVEIDGSLSLAVGPMYKKRAVKVVTDADAWKRNFWGARKHSRRTFNQVYAWTCKQLEHSIPRNLPLMPAKFDDWSKPVADVSFSDLIQGR